MNSPKIKVYIGVMTYFMAPWYLHKIEWYLEGRLVLFQQ